MLDCSVLIDFTVHFSKFMELYTVWLAYVPAVDLQK